MPHSADRASFLEPRLDLGARALWPEWKALASRDGLARDLEQGLILAAWTLPLSLFLATLSGVPASSAVISAAIGSAVCVLLGGTHVALSGPGLTTALLTSSIVHHHGLGGLGAVLVLVGLGQLALGALGIGRFVRAVPLSAIRGYVVAIGLLLIAGQLPFLAGVAIEDTATPLERLDRIGAHVPHASPIVLAIAGGSVLVTLLSFVHRRIPGALLAVVLATIVLAVTGAEAPMLEESASFPLPSVPDLPSRGLASLLGKALLLFLTAALSTSMSTNALERITSRRQDPDQDLIANGVATVALAFLGGVPTTQLIARSAIGARIGVSTRRPALVQALVVLIAGLAAWPVMHLVPTAALTGVAIAVAIPMLDPRPLRDLARVSRLDIVVALVTIAMILVVGLVEGLVGGMVVALVIATARLARTRAIVHESKDPTGAHHLSFSGPITFLASLELEKLRARLAKIEPSHGLVVDLRSVLSLDASGADGLIAALDGVRVRGGKIALLAPSMAVRERLQRADENARHVPGIEAGTLAGAIAPNDREVDRLLGKERSMMSRPHLLAGLERFRDEMREHYDSLFAHLADGQHPHTMFVTCADSRVDPGLLMGSHPGDLFIVRAIGALLPPAGTDSMPQEGAALEYAIGVLGVRNIVICGHSKCGAISALKKGHVPHELATLEQWAKGALSVTGDLAAYADTDDAVRGVTVRQLDNLRTYPIVRDKLAKGELTVHAWFYDLGAVELYEWSEQRKKFSVLGAETRASLPTPTPAPPARPADVTTPGE